MSGYEGAGTNMDGPEFEGGAGVADSSIAGAAPNSDLSLSDQYAEYGAGRQAAELAAGYGIGREGGYSNTAGTPAQQGAFLAGVAPTPAEQVEAARPGVLESVGRALLGLLGVASGTPQGVVGGALGLSSVGKSSGLFASNPAASDLGFDGNLGRAQFSGGFAGSAAPNLFAGSDGPPDAGFIAGAPVLGFAGATSPAASAPSDSGVGLAGFAPGAALQYPAGFAPGAPAQSSGSGALLLLAGLASLFFMG